LNSTAQQDDLKQITTSLRPYLVYIQEIKMELNTPSIIRNSLGLKFENNFYFLSANETRVNLLAARDTVIQLQNSTITNHTISTVFYRPIHQQPLPLSLAHIHNGSRLSRSKVSKLRKFCVSSDKQPWHIDLALSCHTPQHKS
jgi:hypothetical protein